MTYRDFIPPIILQAARKLATAGTRSPTFASYAEALRECAGYGYEANELVEVVYRKTIAYRQLLQSPPSPLMQSDALALFTLALAGRDGKLVSVIDFGGACGAHFFRIEALLRTDLNLRWCVVETPAMARRAKSLETDSLLFFDSLEAAAKSIGNVDIVYSSGTLQCVPDPHETLNQLIGCGARYLVLPRVGLSEDGEEVITFHQAKLSDNGPGPLPEGIRDGQTRYPFTFPSRQRIETQLSREYQILLASKDDSGVFPVGNKRLVGLGYLSKRKL